jgi:hypothetical protein
MCDSDESCCRVSDIRHLAARTDELFKISIEQRLLPSEIVLKSVVTGICALWNARLVRSGTPPSHIPPTRKLIQELLSQTVVRCQAAFSRAK